jgi:hypothetical protein
MLLAIRGQAGSASLGHSAGEMVGRARFRRSDDVVKKAAGRCRSENAMSKVTGGCLCGAVRYELNSAPKLSVSCHCRDCQYVSGGASARSHHARRRCDDHARAGERVLDALSQGQSGCPNILRGLRHTPVCKEREASRVPAGQSRRSGRSVAVSNTGQHLDPVCPALALS